MNGACVNGMPHQMIYKLSVQATGPRPMDRVLDRIRRTCPLITVTVVLLSTSAGVSANQPTWHSRVYRVTEGLPSALVSAIAQDQQGYLWLGTALGLVRFDGTDFVEWNDDGETALPFDSVT